MGTKAPTSPRVRVMSDLWEVLQHPPRAIGHNYLVDIICTPPGAMTTGFVCRGDKIGATARTDHDAKRDSEAGELS